MMELKILLVDDNPDLLGAMRKIIEKENYQILTADNGYDCLHIIDNERPDIVLLDQIILVKENQ